MDEVTLVILLYVVAFGVVFFSVIFQVLHYVLSEQYQKFKQKRRENELSSTLQVVFKSTSATTAWLCLSQYQVGQYPLPYELRDIILKKIILLQLQSCGISKCESRQVRYAKQLERLGVNDHDFHMPEHYRKIRFAEDLAPMSPCTITRKPRNYKFVLTDEYGLVTMKTNMKTNTICAGRIKIGLHFYWRDQTPIYSKIEISENNLGRVRRNYERMPDRDGGNRIYQLHEYLFDDERPIRRQELLDGIKLANGQELEILRTIYAPIGRWMMSHWDEI